MLRKWNDYDDLGDGAGDHAWSPELSFGDPDAWRGDVHLDEWPEWSAGPEYRMWKRLAEGDGE